MSLQSIAIFYLLNGYDKSFQPKTSDRGGTVDEARHFSFLQGG